MNLILQAVKALFRKVEAAIPTKLSDLVNDLKFPTPDWIENDPAKAAYIKNRPFYEEITEAVGVEEQTIIVDESGRAELTRNPDLWPNLGSTFTVVFDGVRYAGTVYEDSDMCTRTDFTTEDGTPVCIWDLYSLSTSANLAGEHTISIMWGTTVAHKIDEKFLPEQKVLSVNNKTGNVSISAESLGAATTESLNLKMDKTNPSGTGSFSMNRSTGATIGEYSHAEGDHCTASEDASHAEGKNTKASGKYSHAEGYRTRAISSGAHAEGYSSDGSGNIEIDGKIYANHEVLAEGTGAHAEGHNTKAIGRGAHAQGDNTVAYGDASDASGRYNVIDTANKYACIVGNGSLFTNRSNAHTLDWNGVPWYQGRPQFGGNAQDDGAQTVMANGDKELILTSSTEGSTKKFKITVDDSGTLTATEVTE